jgi:lysophospholipase L1-like esterase
MFRKIVVAALGVAVVVVAAQVRSAQFVVEAQAPAAPPAQAQQPPPPPLPSGPEMAVALRAAVTNDIRTKDWANLARYREANKAVTTAPIAVFMGDSITDSWQAARFNFFPGKGYIDRGISGQTTPQMLVRFRADVIALKPKVVVILAGTNDIAGNTGPISDEEIQGYLASMCELAVANGIKVVLSSITPVSEYHGTTAALQTMQRPMSRIKANNDWMKAYASAHKHIYLDYFSAMTDAKGLLRTELSADDLHPNADGYAIMGPLAEAAIAKALAAK